MFMLRLIRIIAEELRKVKGVEFAFLFGSFSRGKVHKFSDIDIGVYLSKEIPLRELLKHIPISDIPVDLKILNDSSPLFRLRVLKEGQLLFVKNEKILKDFIYDTLVKALEYKEIYERLIKKFSKRVLYGL